MLLEGGLKWQTLSLSPADMDFAGLKAAAAREIALAFGVPPMLLGLPGDATYANYREANKALWRQAILPLAGKILDALSEGLRPWFADLKLAVDLDAVPALSEDRERLWAQVGAADFLTPEEKRAAVGLPTAAEIVAKPSNDEKNIIGKFELKYNPWHDTQNGQFTHEGQGARYGTGGGSFGGGGASGSWDKPKTKPSAGFGGGGASGSWNKPKAKLEKPKREQIKPSIAAPGKPKLVVPEQPKTRKVKANGYHFEVDEQNRTVRARGELRLEEGQGRNRRRQRDEGKPDRLTSDEGGHFIARQFGGPKEAINLFAQDRNFNRSGYASLETQWRNSLKSGMKVYVDIQAYYPEKSNRPDKLEVRYFVDGKEHFNEFPNKNEGKKRGRR